MKPPPFEYVRPVDLDGVLGDIPLAKIIDICFKARPTALSFEAANPP